MDPRSNSTNLQKGLEWVVYSFFKYCFFPSSSAASSHTFSFSRSHPGNWHFPQPSKSVFLHHRKEEYNQGTRLLQKKWASPRLAPAGEPAVGTCLLHAAL